MTDAKRSLSALEIPAAHAAAPATGRRRPNWARRHRAYLYASDTAVILLALAAALTVDAVGPASGAPRPQTAAGALGLFALWQAALAVNRSRDQLVAGMGVREYRRVAGASAVSFGLFAIAILAADLHGTRTIFLVALPAGTVLLVGTRWQWRRWVVRRRARGQFTTTVLVAGYLEDVTTVVARIRAVPSAYRVVAAAVTDTNTGAVVGVGEPVPIVGDVGSVASAVHTAGVETVIIASRPRGDDDFVRALSWQLEGSATQLVLAAPLTDVAGPRIHFEPVENLPLIHVQIPRFEGGKHLLKRAVDLAASTAGLLLLLPAFAVIAIAIAIDDPGPVLFRQSRVGRNGQSFRMYKFRSMVTTAERDRAALLADNEASGPLFKVRNDPRVTRVGAILRRYSLDELPQLWNVWRGQMSLVGPRPPLQSEVDAYESAARRRLYLKPGLTGLWQVSGRSDLSWEESIRLDLYYVENWSLTGDLILLWRTVRAVLRPKGAY